MGLCIAYSQFIAQTFLSHDDASTSQIRIYLFSLVSKKNSLCLIPSTLIFHFWNTIKLALWRSPAKPLHSNSSGWPWNISFFPPICVKFCPPLAFVPRSSYLKGYRILSSSLCSTHSPLLFWACVWPMQDLTLPTLFIYHLLLRLELRLPMTALLNFSLQFSESYHTFSSIYVNQTSISDPAQITSPLPWKHIFSLTFLIMSSVLNSKMLRFVF